MNRTTARFLAVTVCALVAPPVHADFLIGTFSGYLVTAANSRVVHNDGSIALTPTGGPNGAHETYDSFILSADAQRIFAFANDLGSITTESWSAVSGAYLGPVGPQYPNPISGQPQPWPNFQPNYAIGEVHTRSTFPAFGGDLLYVGPARFENGTFTSNKPVINVVNTSSHQFVEQIVPPASATQIYDFTMGPGSLGPKSHVYLNTNGGVFVFNETPVVDTNPFHPDYDHFDLVSTTPLPIPMSPLASFDINPVDGYLYVLDGTGAASSIKRYNTSTGALIDTFLTFEQYNFGGKAGRNLKFGPDGGLYFSTQRYISRFDVATRLRTNDFNLSSTFDFDNFYILPVPEPASAVLLVIAGLFLQHRWRRC
jgi:hypothetical protein